MMVITMDVIVATIVIVGFALAFAFLFIRAMLYGQLARVRRKTEKLRQHALAKGDER